MRRNPTTLMIAEEAQVSRASVYAVLNSPSKTNIGVSGEKRRRILEVAKKLGYVRNATAQSLKTGKYNSIAVVAQSIAHAQFYRFFNTFDRMAGHHGYFTFLTSSEYDFEQERHKLNAILEQGVDALVIGLLHHEQNHDILQKYYRRHIPVIILGNVLGKNRDAILVGFDEAAGARKIAEYLYDAGLDRIAYFKWFNDDRFKDSGFDARANYFKTACTQLDPNYTPEIFSCRREDQECAGEALVAQLLEQHRNQPLSRAIICSNDILAVDTIAALNRHGLKVPADIAVIGYDNLNKTNKFMFSLTTLDLPFEQLAESCWQVLEKRLNGSSPTDRIEPVMVAPKLLIRESSPAQETHAILN